jgi:hypothetical protein
MVNGCSTEFNGHRQVRTQKRRRGFLVQSDIFTGLPDYLTVSILVLTAKHACISDYACSHTLMLLTPIIVERSIMKVSSRNGKVAFATAVLVQYRDRVGVEGAQC